MCQVDMKMKDCSVGIFSFVSSIYTIEKQFLELEYLLQLWRELTFNGENQCNNNVCNSLSLVHIVTFKQSLDVTWQIT